MREQFIFEATAYCQAKGIELRQLSKRVVDDGTLFDRLKNTGRVTVSQIERIQADMAENPVEVEDLAHDGPSDEAAA